jgi:hypothetical protein
MSLAIRAKETKNCPFGKRTPAPQENRANVPMALYIWTLLDNNEISSTRAFATMETRDCQTQTPKSQLRENERKCSLSKSIQSESLLAERASAAFCICFERAV